MYAKGMFQSPNIVYRFINIIDILVSAIKTSGSKSCGNSSMRPTLEIKGKEYMQNLREHQNKYLQSGNMHIYLSLKYHEFKLL